MVNFYAQEKYKVMDHFVIWSWKGMGKSWNSVVSEVQEPCLSYFTDVIGNRPKKRMPNLKTNLYTTWGLL